MTLQYVIALCNFLITAISQEIFIYGKQESISWNKFKYVDLKSITLKQHEVSEER